MCKNRAREAPKTLLEPEADFGAMFGPF